jgi:hypothetical protein
MLSNKEKEFLKEILILMSEKDLQLLAQTVTNNMIVPLTTEGKLMSKNIVTHDENMIGFISTLVMLSLLITINTALWLI